ncbi:MAG TPA: hypothetical protein VIM53_01275 [Candidatus Saccharimonadales bacterium]
MSEAIDVQRQHIGMGPMGTAVFYAAHNLGAEVFDGVCAGGVAVINPRLESVGSGGLENLAIATNSDPADAIRYVPATPPFGLTAASRAAREVLEGMDGYDYCGFPELTRYYRAVGRELLDYIMKRDDGSCAVEASVARIVCDERHGTFTSFDTHGVPIIRSHELVLATGAVERQHAALLPYAGKTVMSRSVLAHDPEVAEKLAVADAAGKRSVVILGSGNSAISALGELTKLPEAQNFTFVVAHRSKFYLHYATQAAAERDGYALSHDELSAGAPCPVNRVRGLRAVARETLERAQRGELGDVLFIRFDGDLRHFEALNKAGIIVQALGYEGSMPQMVDARQRAISLMTDAGNQVVDADDQLVTASGSPVERAYRVGFGVSKAVGWEVAGFAAEGALRKGPVNSFKAFQGPGGSGEQLVKRLLS